MTAMTTATIENRVRRALTSVGVGDAATIDATVPLELDSLTVVRLHEALELEFSSRIPARHVRPESFAHVAALTQLMEQLLA